MGHQQGKKRYTRPTIGELDKFRVFLGDIAAQYNQAELAQLYWEMHEMTKLLLDIYQYRHGQNMSSGED